MDGSLLPDELIYEDDHYETESSRLQKECEADVGRFFKRYDSLEESQKFKLRLHGVVNSESLEFMLYRDKTIAYLMKKSGLAEGGLGESYTSLGSSRPWLLYWSIHTLQLLGALNTESKKETDMKVYRRAYKTLKDCYSETGGFNGGYKPELPHTAPTYAVHQIAVLSIVTLGTEEAYKIIERKRLYKWLLSLKDDQTKAFRVQKDGEIDTRGLYTVLAVASICNMLTPELVTGTAEYIGECQTYEGGIGGEPGNEAHGGYAFCGLAALHILKRFDTIDFDALTKWIAARQMQFEGGFQGRTNKLVDSCYSFWQGAIPVLLSSIPKTDDDGKSLYSHRISAVSCHNKKGNSLLFGQDDLYETCGPCLFDQIRLQQYLILSCQFVEGGLRDKPSKPRDQYHTCYALSGLSLAQHFGPTFTELEAQYNIIWGDRHNLLRRTDPIYNVEVGKLEKAKEYFSKLPSSHRELIGD